MIRVNIPEYSAAVNFPDGTPLEEIQKAIASKFPQKVEEPIPKGVPTPEGHILEPYAPEIPGNRPAGIYAETTGERFWRELPRVTIPFYRQMVGEKEWQSPETAVEAAGLAIAPSAMGNIARRMTTGPAMEIIGDVLIRNKDALRNLPKIDLPAPASLIRDKQPTLLSSEVSQPQVVIKPKTELRKGYQAGEGREPKEVSERVGKDTIQVSPKKTYEGPTPIIGLEPGEAEAVGKALEKPAFLRDASDHIILKKKGPLIESLKNEVRASIDPEVQVVGGRILKPPTVTHTQAEKVAPAPSYVELPKGTKIEPIAESGKLNPAEIKALGIPKDQVRILDQIRKENPEEYAKILKGNTKALVAEWESKRIGKTRGMAQEDIFAKPTGGLFGKKEVKQRFVASNEGMMKGYWKVLDTETGNAIKTGISSKKAAEDIAKTTKLEGISGSIPNLPAKPKTQNLVQWVRNQGGIWDESLKGETKQFLGQEAGIRGLVSKGGKPFDELAKNAIDEGWLPDGSTAREFIDLLTKDVAGAKGTGPRVIPNTGSTLRNLEKYFEDMRILGNERGSISFRGTGQQTPPPQILPPSADNVKLMYEVTEKTIEEMNSLTLPKIRNWLTRGFVDVSGNVKRELVQKGGVLGREIVREKELISGATPRAAQIMDTAHDAIYGGLNSRQEKILDRIIQSRRTAQIDLVRGRGLGQPVIQHPMGQTGSAHSDYLNQLGRLEGLDATQIADLNTKATAYFDVMKSQLQDLYDNGIITQQLHQKLANLEYSPREFLQHIDPVETISIGGKLINVPGSGIQSLKEGSLNLLENKSKKLISEVVVRTQNRIARNNANVKLYELLQATPNNGVVKAIPAGGNIPTGFVKVNAMIQGQTKEMMMPVEMAQEWVTSDPLINHTLAETLQWISGSKILKAMATGYNPAFAISNTPRDLALIWMANKEYSPHLPVAFGQQLRDVGAVFMDAVKRSGRYTDYVKQGGGMELMTHYGRVGGVAETNNLTKYLGYIGETSELLGRLSIRERAIRNGKTAEEATAIARNYLDFSQGGNVSKALDTVMPYFNATIQGTRSIVRSAKTDPAVFTYKAAQLTALASSLYMANNLINPEAYRQVSDREKEANFIVTTPWSYVDDKGNKRYIYYKIAKDQGQRIFMSAGEALMARYFEGKFPKEQMLKGIGDFIGVSPTQSIPPSVGTYLSYVMNKNLWTNEDLWKGPKMGEGFEKEEFKPGQTPSFATKWGELTGMSPERSYGAAQKLIPFGNPYIGLVGGTYKMFSGELSEDFQSKSTKQILLENPSIRRAVSQTNPYQEFKTESEEVRAKGKAENWVQSRTVDNLSEKYLKTKDPNTLKELEVFLSKQPEADQDKLIKRAESIREFWNIPDRSWWVNLKHTNDPETRAQLFWVRYQKMSPEKKKEMVAIVDVASGINTDRFGTELEKLAKSVSK